MEPLKTDFLKIIRTERSVFVLMIVNFLAALALAIFAFVSVNPTSARTKFGYSDIGAYRDGSWSVVFAFALFALIFGVLHGLIGVRIFRKRGSGMAKFFLAFTTCLILSAFLVLIRVLGEG